jgi:hypothetical protein
MFTIVGMQARAVNAIGAHDVWEAIVTVRIDAKAWAAARKRPSGLGQLYGIDVGNAVYRLNPNINTYRPTVNDKARASKGFKTIVLHYQSTDLERAAAVGLEVRTFGNGERVLAYGSRVNLMSGPSVPVGAPKLKLIVGG